MKATAFRNLGAGPAVLTVAVFNIKKIDYVERIKREREEARKAEELRQATARAMDIMQRKQMETYAHRLAARWGK